MSPVCSRLFSPVSPFERSAVKPDASKAREGREQMKLRCQAIAAKYFAQIAQLGSAVHHERRSLTGRAYIYHEPQDHWCWVRVIEAPRPVTRRALYIFLHECAHHLLGHLKDRKPKHVHELEAEQWAHWTMRAEGLAVPRKESARAKKYVARKIQQALKRGAKSIDPKAARFAGLKATKAKNKGERKHGSK